MSRRIKLSVSGHDAQGTYHLLFDGGTVSSKTFMKPGYSNVTISVEFDEDKLKVITDYLEEGGFNDIASMIRLVLAGKSRRSKAVSKAEQNIQAVNGDLTRPLVMRHVQDGENWTVEEVAHEIS
jgi:hypothetical protein